MKTFLNFLANNSLIKPARLCFQAPGKSEAPNPPELADKGPGTSTQDTAALKAKYEKAYATLRKDVDISHDRMQQGKYKSPDIIKLTKEYKGYVDGMPLPPEAPDELKAGIASLNAMADKFNTRKVQYAENWLAQQRAKAKGPVVVRDATALDALDAANFNRGAGEVPVDWAAGEDVESPQTVDEAYAMAVDSLTKAGVDKGTMEDLLMQITHNNLNDGYKISLLQLAAESAGEVTPDLIQRRGELIDNVYKTNMSHEQQALISWHALSTYNVLALQLQSLALKNVADPSSTQEENYQLADSTLLNLDSSSALNGVRFALLAEIEQSSNPDSEKKALARSVLLAKKDGNEFSKAQQNVMGSLYAIGADHKVQFVTQEGEQLITLGKMFPSTQPKDVLIVNDKPAYFNPGDKEYHYARSATEYGQRAIVKNGTSVVKPIPGEVAKYLRSDGGMLA